MYSNSTTYMHNERSYDRLPAMIPAKRKSSSDITTFNRVSDCPSYPDNSKKQHDNSRLHGTNSPPRTLPSIAQLTQSLNEEMPEVLGDHKRTSSHPVSFAIGGSPRSNSRDIQSGESIYYQRPANTNSRFIAAEGRRHSAEDSMKQNRYSPHASLPLAVARTQATIAFRHDMERIEDKASRLYYFAAYAAPGTGTVPGVPANTTEIKMPDLPEFSTAIEHARNVLNLLESWRDAEYGESTDASLSTVRTQPLQPRPPEISPFHAQTWTTTPTTPTTPTTHHNITSQDNLDFEHMRNRKRASMKVSQGLSLSGSGAPRATPTGRCHSCNISETPEWRRGPDGARTLCNACGLHFAKLTKRKQQQEQDLEQKHGKLDTKHDFKIPSIHAPTSQFTDSGPP